MVEIRNLNGEVIYTNKDIKTLSGTDLSDADLRGANLSFADLSCADLRNADLRNADLRDADLSFADLRNADLRFTILSFANLRGADLRGAGLRNANLENTNLNGADLRGADLSDADLRGAYLSCADLRNADLRNADLRDAGLKDANLDNVIYDTTTLFFTLQCPEEDSFTAWKKVNDKFLIKLEIPADAERSSATSRKCRCSKAKVLGIYNRDKELLDIQEITNYRYRTTAYKVGEMVYPDSWDSNRWNECSNGIHFFMTFDEAKNY